MKRCWLTFLGLLSIFGLEAQGITETSFPAMSASLGNQSGTLIGANALFANPAGLALATRISLQANTANGFLLSELTEGSLGLCMPTTWGTFGLGLATFGFDQYRENGLSLSYGRSLGKPVHIGVRFHYLQSQVISYDNQHSWLFDVGIMTKPVQGLRFGVFLQNPSNSSWSSATDASINNQVHIGIAYELSNQIEIFTSMQKVNQFDPNFHFGLSYSISDQLIARMGYSTLPGSINFGIGAEVFEQFVIDLGMQVQTILGLSPSLSVSYNISSPDIPR